MPLSKIDSDSLNSGVPTRAQLPAGSVLQVVNATYSSETSTTSASFVTTGLNASITPTSITSKILILVSIPAFNTGTSTYASFFTLFRGTVAGTNLNNTSPTRGFGDVGINSTAQNLSTIVNMSSIDSPSTTSAQTYTVGFRSENATNTVTVCRSSGVASLTLMEIAA